MKKRCIGNCFAERQHTQRDPRCRVEEPHAETRTVLVKDVYQIAGPCLRRNSAYHAVVDKRVVARRSQRDPRFRPGLTSLRRFSAKPRPRRSSSRIHTRPLARRTSSWVGSRHQRPRPLATRTGGAVVTRWVVIGIDSRRNRAWPVAEYEIKERPRDVAKKEPRTQRADQRSLSERVKHSPPLRYPQSSPCLTVLPSPMKQFRKCPIPREITG